MADTTKIAWTDSTFNPWMGCTKVSPACDHCYAERDTARFGRVQWGAGRPRVRTSVGNWKKPLQWNARLFCECPHCGHRGEPIMASGLLPAAGQMAICQKCKTGPLKPARRRIFCASLADVFDNEVDPKWRYDLFNLILSTPNLDWLLLTKRIGNAARMIEETLPESMKTLPADHALAWPWPHVWIGATICNQEEADRDIPKLLDVPAAMRFLSIEPLLGPVDISRFLRPRQKPNNDGYGGDRAPGWTTDCTALDWVIVGGESGRSARPMNAAWVENIRRQCAAADVAFFFKQWGGNGADKGGCLVGGGEVKQWPAAA